MLFIFLRTHVKISSKISIIEFNIQIKWCIIVTPSREAEKDYQGYFNSPPHKKNHIATTIINTVLFKISTHILTKRMTAHELYRWTIGCYFNSHPHEEDDTSLLSCSPNLSVFQLTSSRRGWLFVPSMIMIHIYFNSHPHEEDDLFFLMLIDTSNHFNSHPHEDDDYSTFFLPAM